MFKIDKETGTIHLTRGDIATLAISAKVGRSQIYVFQKGDVVRFRLIDKNDCNCVRLVKDVVVENEGSEVYIFFESTDTKIDTIPNKAKEYWYEVELNPETAPQTIIGYDTKGAKKFILYPEGSDINA